MSDQYYYAINNKRHGPVPFSKLRSLATEGTLKRVDKLWTHGMKEWVAAGSNLELFDGLPPDLSDTAEEHGAHEPPPLSSTQPGSAMKRKRTPWLIALVSFFLPGLGQLICGQKNKGILFLAVGIVGGFFSGGISGLFLCPILALDGFSVAQKTNLVGRVGEWEFCPTLPEINRIKSEFFAAILVGLTVISVLYVQHQRAEESDAKADQFVNLLHQLMQEQ